MDWKTKEPKPPKPIPPHVKDDLNGHDGKWDTIDWQEAYAIVNRIQGQIVKSVKLEKKLGEKQEKMEKDLGEKQEKMEKDLGLRLDRLESRIGQVENRFEKISQAFKEASVV